MCSRRISCIAKNVDKFCVISSCVPEPEFYFYMWLGKKEAPVVKRVTIKLLPIRAIMISIRDFPRSTTRTP
jgi:hypothetical protein